MNDGEDPLASGSDGRDLTNAREPFPDLEAVIRGLVGVVQHLKLSNRRQRSAQVAVNRLELLAAR